MSNLTIIEIICICIILLLQLRSFIITKKNIDELKTIVPPQEECRIEKVTRQVPTEDRFYYLDEYFARYQGFDLLRDYLKNDLNVQQGGVVDFEVMTAYSKLTDEQKDFYKFNQRAVNFEVQRKPPMKNEEFFRIIYLETNETIDSLNKYLEKNKGVVADFSLLRDITQRNLDVVEDEINLIIQTPLFLGLAGTMFGIIVGVFSLTSTNFKTLLEDDGINSLLVSVMIAMVASFLGLVLTTLNSAVYLKGIKVRVERNKNRFFTFLQTELIPVLSENVTTGIIGLNRSIEKFGESFRINVVQLEGMIGKNHESLMAQQRSIEELKKVDISQLAKLNINVFAELRNSMDALEKLSYSLSNIDNLVANSKEIVQRTQDVGNISSRIGQLIDQSLDLQNFLNSHFKELSHRGQVINDTVGKVDEAIGKSLDDLKLHTKQRIQAVMDIQLKEEDILSSKLGNKRELEAKINSMEIYVEEFKKFASEESRNQKSILSALNNNNTLLNTLIQQNKNKNQTLVGSIPKSGRMGNIIIGPSSVVDEVKPETISTTKQEKDKSSKFRLILRRIVSVFKRTKKEYSTKEIFAKEAINQAPNDQLNNLDSKSREQE